MRYVLVPAALIALLALACDGDGEEPPAVTSTQLLAVTEEPSPGAATGGVDIRDLVLRPEDVPAALGQLGEPMVYVPHRLVEEGVTNPLEGDLEAGGVVALAAQAYNSPEPFPPEGAQLIGAGVTLTEALENATSIFLFFTGGVPRVLRQAVLEDEASRGRDLSDYEELSAPAIGEEALLVHYFSRGADEPTRLEYYLLTFRRDRAVGSIRLLAPEGNVTRQQVTELAKKLDERIQEGLE